MSLIESFHNIKKSIIHFYRANFTIEGQYTCLLPDRIYLKKTYLARTGKKLQLRNPRTYCEKLQWLKLHDRKKEYTVMVDKYLAKEYVENIIGKEYVIPLLGVWENADDIDFNLLPDKFVLKCNHDNGVIICRDKSTFDIDNTRIVLQDKLQRDYYKKLREWPYKKVPRRIIAEPFMSNADGSDPVDYKFFCFGGKARFFEINSGRYSSSGTKTDFYDMDWNELDIDEAHCLHSGILFKKPEYFDEMTLMAESLSTGIRHCRIDFCVFSGRVYFGEITFFHGGGFIPFEPQKWEQIVGDMIDL